jgi:hypothetical protein
LRRSWSAPPCCRGPVVLGTNSPRRLVNVAAGRKFDDFGHGRRSRVPVRTTRRGIASEGVAHGAMVAPGFQGEQPRGGGSAPAPVDPRSWPAANERA